MNYITDFISMVIIASMPLLFATLGELLTERVGNLNLGVEGMMLLGAIGGFLTAFHTGSFSLGILVGFLVGMAGAFIYGFLTISLRANQVVTGLALTTFGTGIATVLGANVIGESLVGNTSIWAKNLAIPLLSKIPVIGSAFFSQSLFTYFGYIVAVIAGVFLYKTTYGLNATAVGEDPAVADATSINVSRYKYLITCIGGGLVGLGGAYMSLIYVPSWSRNIINGRGWIAVALVIFVKWNPYVAILGATLFGGLSILGAWTNLSLTMTYIVDTLPYLVTVLMLIITSISKSRKSGPRSLGVPYFKEER
jgi:Uncharacterized ABC-type transport system, permease component